MLNLFISPDYTAYYVTRSVFLSASTLLLVGIVYLLVLTGYLKTRWFKDLAQFFYERPYGTSGPQKRWEQIKGYLESDSESKLKLAVMEADNLLNKALERMEFKGDNLEERLERVPGEKISNLKEVKLAHGLRDDVAYDPDYQLKKREVEEALDIYERALKDLEVI